MAYAIHKYFNDNGYFYIHTPIITGTDAEGAGETFRVTTLPVGTKEEVSNENDFFGKPTHFNCFRSIRSRTGGSCFGEKAYTFGPTFRAENSNTTRHLAEFWMIEPELAFADIHDNMNLGEDFLKYLIQYAKDHCSEDLAFLNDRALKEEQQLPKDKRNEFSLLERMQMVLDHDFERITYSEAIDILLQSKTSQKEKI